MKYILLYLVLFFAVNVNAQLDQLIDDWHKAAANADFETYFELMDESFVFLGTAPGERWIKKDFADFSKPYFDAGNAWDFKASNRVWMFSKNRKIAWFDEDLETWMEGCRGSGILEKKKRGVEVSLL